MKPFKEKHRDDYFEILRDFEVKKKSIKPELEEKVTFKIPISLHETNREVKGEDLSRTLMMKQELNQVITLAGDKLRIQPEKMKALFSETSDKILQHLKSIFCLPQVQDVDTVLMVGGFSESPMLQDAIKNGLKNKKVVIPLDAGLAVLKGAVIYGHHPQAIVSRVSKHTYGIKMYKEFIPGEHDDFRKVIIDGEVYCEGVFDKHVEIGQEVKEGTAFGEHSYVPVRRDGTCINLIVFTTKNTNPKYIDGCHNLGCLAVDLNDPAIVSYADKKVLVKMIYGGTELGLEAKVVKTGKIVDAKFNFLG